jgi:hypothetical protein
VSSSFSRQVLARSAISLSPRPPLSLPLYFTSFLARMNHVSRSRATCDWPPLFAGFTAIPNKGPSADGLSWCLIVFRLVCVIRESPLRKLRPLIRFPALPLLLSIFRLFRSPSFPVPLDCQPNCRSAFRFRADPSAFRRMSTQLSPAALTRLLQILQKARAAFARRQGQSRARWRGSLRK